MLRYGLDMEYFFSDGWLTGDEILSQLLRCIVCCETVGLQVYMVGMDASGANSSLFSTLRGSLQLGNKRLLPEDTYGPMCCMPGDVDEWKRDPL